VARANRLADVAKAAGVSQGTASNVFNRPELVRPEVRDRVEDAARRLGYSGPDPKGRLLRGGKVNAIGVVVHERLATFLSDPFGQIMLAGVAEVLDAEGAGMALISAYADDETPAWSIGSAVVDGFVVFCLAAGDRLLEATRRRGLPFVVIDLDPGPGISSIGIDDRAGAAAAARHLLALGHRRFGILSLEILDDGRFGPVDALRRRAVGYGGTRERLAGYDAAFAGAGIPFDDVPIMEVFNNRDAARAATAELLAVDPGITAILAMSDVLALGALDHAAAAGILVPEGLSVVGFDDIPAAGEAGLTTIAQPIREKGRRAAELVFAGGAPRREVLDIRLVVRSSTGTAPAGPSRAP
jgi:DNA-binding LacI/PurR family transcriptional regulator